MTAKCPYTLQWDAPSPPKIAASNTWFPGPTRVLNPNGILIGSAIFAGFASVTDCQTDLATQSVIIGRIYECSTGMQPKNDNSYDSIAVFEC